MLNSCILNPKVDPLRSHSCYCALDATASGIKGSHTPISDLVRRVLSLQHEICVLQAMTERCETWQQGYESISFVARYSFLNRWAGLNEARCDTIYFASRVGPCMGIVESCKYLLAHPQFLALELRAPMGACSGQYGMSTGLHGNDTTVSVNTS